MYEHLKKLTIVGNQEISEETVREHAYETFKDRPLTTSDRFLELYDEDGNEVYELNEAVAVSCLIKQMIIGGENFGATCPECGITTMGHVDIVHVRDTHNRKQVSPAYLRVYRTYQKHKKMGHNAILVHFPTK